MSYELITVMPRKGRVIKVDSEYAELVRKLLWQENKRLSLLSARGQAALNAGLTPSQSLASIILGEWPHNQQYVFLNDDVNDYRKENLALAPIPKKLVQPGSQPKGKKLPESGYFGVYQVEGRFVSRVRVGDNKKKHLVSSSNPVICALAYDAYLVSQGCEPMNFPLDKLVKVQVQTWATGQAE